MGPRRSDRNSAQARLNEVEFDDEEQVTTDDILTPATKEERQRWNGFCEIESDPVGSSYCFI